jgi:hypothetical protein
MQPLADVFNVSLIAPNLHSHFNIVYTTIRFQENPASMKKVLAKLAIATAVPLMVNIYIYC